MFDQSHYVTRRWNKTQCGQYWNHHPCFVTVSQLWNVTVRPSYVRKQQSFRVIQSYRHVYAHIGTPTVARRQIFSVDEYITRMRGRPWRVSRAVTRAPRCRVDGGGPSASIAAVACAPMEARCLRLAKPGRWWANVVETLDVTGLTPIVEFEYTWLAVLASFMKIIAAWNVNLALDLIYKCMGRFRVEFSVQAPKVM